MLATKEIRDVLKMMMYNDLIQNDDILPKFSYNYASIVRTHRNAGQKQRV